MMGGSSTIYGPGLSTLGDSSFLSFNTKADKLSSAADVVKAILAAGVARVSTYTTAGHHSPLHYAAGAGELPALKLLDKAAVRSAHVF